MCTANRGISSAVPYVRLKEGWLGTDRSRWTLARRLAAAFATLIVLIIALGGASVGSSLILRQGASEMYTWGMPALDSLVEADRDLQQLLVAERTLMFAEPGSTHSEQLSPPTRRTSASRTRAGSVIAPSPAPRRGGARPGLRGARASGKSKPPASEPRKTNLSGPPRPRGADPRRRSREVRRDARLPQPGAGAEPRTRRRITPAPTTRSATPHGRLRLPRSPRQRPRPWRRVGGRTSRQIREVASNLHAGADQVVSAAGRVAASAYRSRGATDQAAPPRGDLGLDRGDWLDDPHHRRRADSRRHADGGVPQRVADANQSLGPMVSAMAGDARVQRARLEDHQDDRRDRLPDQHPRAQRRGRSARAGEAGMGFAVVADEVRNLAQRAAQAARDTTS